MLGDIVSTEVRVQQGAQEMNPLAKQTPAGVALVSTAAVELAATKLVKDGHAKSATWLYRGCAVVHFAAASWNASQSPDRSKRGLR